MPETRSPLFRLAAVAAIIAAVVPVGACGSSPERASTAPAPTTASAPSSASATAAPAPPAAPRRGKDYVAGTVASVSGTTVQVSQAGGTATVNLSSAHISQLSPAQPTDATVNSCIQIRPTRDSVASQNLVARAVVIDTPANGQCTPYTPTTTGAPARRGLRGTVTAVGSGTLTIDGATVALNNNTVYVKRSAATVQTVGNGQCLSARGTNDASGTLQATTATVRTAVNGQCPQRR
jgi:hypothetical protein